MWTRKELKERSKQAMARNRLQAIIAALILAFVEGRFSFTKSSLDVSTNTEAFNESVSEISTQMSAYGSVIALVLIIAIFAGAIIGLLITAFLTGPVKVGGCRFFKKNLTEDAKVNEMLWAFDGGHYMNIVKVTLSTAVIVFLYSLLLIIPGIIKAYEYMMVPYILGEDPDISAKEARRRSSLMMNGNKMDAFVLDLSFIGWEFLSAITLGILGIVYVNPYVYGTRAALYEKLKEIAPIDHGYGVTC